MVLEIPDKYRKIRSKYNHDVYYVDEEHKTKTIDGVVFLEVKKHPNDKKTFLMRRDNIEYF